MRIPFRKGRHRRRAGRPRGKILARLLVALAACLGLVLALVAWWSDKSPREDAQELLLHRVARADFEAFVTEDGDIESSNNIEIRCRVKALNTAGTAILQIVPEGTRVRKDDFIIQFDDSHLKNDFTEQQILVARDRAAVIQAQSDLQTATKTLHEFEKGIFAQERELLEGEIFVAQENLRRAEAYLRYSSRLASQGFISSIELAADRFAVDKATKDVAVAQQKLDVYVEFTRDKLVGEYRAEIEKQKANLEAAEHTLKLSEQRLQEIQEQIANCRVVAPAAGQVVYANDNDRRSDDRIIIQEGTLVREGQIVARLPNPDQMAVDTTINETKVNQVKPGDAARIELDSDRGVFLEGVVEEVNAFPFPQRWFGGPLEYGAKVHISNRQSVILRPGQRATVHIIVAREADVMQVPISTVIEERGGYYCLVWSAAKGWSARRVEVGPNNDQFVVIRDGLTEGEQVSLNPHRYRQLVELPQLQPGSDQLATERPAAAAGDG